MPTYLSSLGDGSLFLSEKEMRTARTDTFLYMCDDLKSQKALWTVSPPFPARLGGGVEYVISHRVLCQTADD